MKNKLKSIGAAAANGAKSVMKFLSRHKVITALIIIALLITGAIGYGHFSSQKNSKNDNLKITAEKRDIEESISDSAVVEPNSEYYITANVSGDIIEDYFEEGDTVKKDDVMYGHCDREGKKGL